MIVEKKKNFEYIDSIALDCKRTKGKHWSGHTHQNHMPAGQGHTLTHSHTIIQAHPHTRVCPMQCTLGLNGCGMDCAEILDLIHCRPKRAQNYSFFPFDQTHKPDTQSIKIHLVHRSVCGMKWIHNALNGNTLREEERETESGTTQHFQFLSEA